MSDDLYQDPILKLAEAADGAGTLPDATARAMVDNPLCGDRVTIALRIENGVIAALAHEVKGCLLCQASAAMIGRHAHNLAPTELRRAAAEAAGLLKREPVTPSWPELADFSPVAKHKSRHSCVLLPFRAAAKALEQVGL